MYMYGSIELEFKRDFGRLDRARILGFKVTADATGALGYAALTDDMMAFIGGMHLLWAHVGCRGVVDPTAGCSIVAYSNYNEGAIVCNDDYFNSQGVLNPSSYTLIQLTHPEPVFEAWKFNFLGNTVPNAQAFVELVCLNART